MEIKKLAITDSGMEIVLENGMRIPVTPQDGFEISKWIMEHYDDLKAINGGRFTTGYSRFADKTPLRFIEE